LVLPLQLALGLIVLVLCAFTPGFFIVRRFPWNPLEKLCGSVGLSLIILWLAAWFVYIFLPSAWTPASFAITGVCVVLGALSLPDIRRLFNARRVRRTAVAFAFLVAWTFTILATIRHYSGAGWEGDWLEHFQRTLVYLNHLPIQTKIIGGYVVPSRPPLAHGIAAFIMAQTADRFEIFQVVFTFLNVLPFLACCLMLPLIARPWKYALLPLAGIFATSPVMMVNATYTGVKAIAAFFIVLAIAFYLRGWKKNSSSRMVMAFLAIAGGSLAHYSGLPYAVFLALHYLIFVFSRHRRWKELAGIATAAAVPLLAWFGWSAAGFGLAGTWDAVVHASIAYGQDTYEGSAILKTLANIFDTIVPHELRDWNLVRAWRQPNTLGYIRDNAFLTYQSSLFFTMGLIGGPLILWLLFRALRGPASPQRNFWRIFVPFMFVACFILAGERALFGLAHLILLTMFAIGLTFLAANFTRRRWISWLIVTGCAIDFTLGVFVQARIEHLENTAQQMPFTRIQFDKQVMDLALPNADTLSRPTGENWFRKHQIALSQKWLAGLALSYPDGRGLTPAYLSARDHLQEVVRQDDTMYGGWYKRHNGEITFFGDLFGDTDWTSLLLLVGAATILVRMARYAPPKAVAAPAARPQAAAKATRARKK
jgi:hypothetical protein